MATSPRCASHTSERRWQLPVACMCLSERIARVWVHIVRVFGCLSVGGVLLMLCWATRLWRRQPSGRRQPGDLHSGKSYHSHYTRGNLQIGEMMAEFPLDPQLAKMLVTSPDFK
jgi:Helicase associated domain (HA2)